MSYPKPSFTVDIIIEGPGPSIVLVQRKNAPFKNYWALPGGFVNKGEHLEVAASRELREETQFAVTPSILRQFKTYGDPGRDPRGWVVSVVFYYQTHIGLINPKAGDDAKEVRIFSLNELPKKIAFDHQRIINEYFAFAYSFDQAEVR